MAVGAHEPSLSLLEKSRRPDRLPLRPTRRCIARRVGRWWNRHGDPAGGCSSLGEFPPVKARCDYRGQSLSRRLCLFEVREAVLVIAGRKPIHSGPAGTFQPHLLSSEAAVVDDRLDRFCRLRPSRSTKWLTFCNDRCQCPPSIRPTLRSGRSIWLELIGETKQSM